MRFTDIHSHVLPGFDDGASDEGEFLEMVRCALDHGTSRMVATPHCDLEVSPVRPEDVRAAVRGCRERLRDLGWELELLPGMEVRINSGLYVMAREDGTLENLTLGESGRYILVDLPLADAPLGMEETLFRIQLRGFKPILAHPERNRCLAEIPGKMRELRQRGIILQVNSGSLCGMYGRTARRTAIALVEEGLASLVASDAHQARGRDPDLSGAWRTARRRWGQKKAELLFVENPSLILAGEDPVPNL